MRSLEIPRCLLVMLVGFGFIPVIGTSAGMASPLGMAEAEQAAIERNLSRQAAEAKAARYRQLAVRAGQLADPQVIIGYENTYGMDEYLVGLRQELPRLGNLKLRRSQQEQLADGERYRGDLAGRAVLRAVRLTWLDLWYQQQAERIITHHVRLLAERAQTARQQYAAGNLSQQQVLLLELEEQMQRDRLLRIHEQADAVRAELGRLIGDGEADRPVTDTLPDLPPLLSQPELVRLLAEHPEVSALQSATRAAGHETALSDQYLSGFMVDLLYGRNDQEEDRFAVMLSVPLPVRPAERQDRGTAAARLQERALQLEQDDALRRLNAEVDAAYRKLIRLEERLALYQGEILPHSRLAGEATAVGYRHSTEDFANLLQIGVYELENQLGYLQLQRDRAATHAMLLFYQEPSP